MKNEECYIVEVSQGIFSQKKKVEQDLEIIERMIKERQRE